MSDNEAKVTIGKAVVWGNVATVFATALCVGLIAIGTGSMHCLWGMLLLTSLQVLKTKTKDDDV